VCNLIISAAVADIVAVLTVMRFGEGGGGHEVVRFSILGNDAVIDDAI
jgi:hypothetical protein